MSGHFFAMQVFCTIDECRNSAYCPGMPNYDAPLQKVLDKVGPTKLADHLGIVPSAVTQWRRVPAHHVPRVAAFTGIPEREIRPDMYPAEEAA